MLGLSPLDDGGHRHHRFLLLHHLGCLDLPVFTRHFYFFFFFFLSSFLSPPPPPSSTTLHRIRKILLSSETRTISLSRHLEKRKKRLADHHHHHLLLLLHLSLLLLLLLLLPSLNRANFPSSFGIDLVSFNALLFGCFAFERSTLDRSTIRNKNGIYCIGF